MPIELWLAFVAASAVLLVLPGPTILTVISYSLAHGRRANVPLVAAVALGDSTALIFSLLGLGALLAASSFWFALVKGVGGVYLLYLGIRLLRAGMTPGQLPAPDAPGSRWRLFANTYLVTASNPKGIVFFVAFLPQFIAADAAHPLGAMLELSAVFMAMTFVVFALYGVFAAAMRDHVVSRPAVMAWMRRSFAAAFVALGARLALTER